MIGEDKKRYILKLFWIFMIASFIGCIVETIVCILEEGHFEVRQGVIYGPFIPVYGAGAVLFYIAVPKAMGITPENAKTKNIIKVFIYSAILGGVTEYIFSYVQEVVMGTVSWEYSHLPFNINGRTGLIHCFYWGISGIIFIRGIYPLTINWGDFTKYAVSTKWIVTTVVVFMFFNMSISIMAGYRQYERTQNISAKTQIDSFLDKHYPDEIMDIIFCNKQTTKDLQKIRAGATK